MWVWRHLIVSFVLALWKFLSLRYWHLKCCDINFINAQEKLRNGNELHYQNKRYRPDAQSSVSLTQMKLFKMEHFTKIHLYTKRNFRWDLSTAHLFSKKKISLKAKTFLIRNKWYLNLPYLSFLNLNDMKCSCSNPTIRCILTR